MKKLFLAALALCAINISAQSFSAMYPFTSVVSGTANTGTVDPTPTPTANGLSFGSFTAVGTPTSPAASGAFAFSSWPTGATNADDVTFTGSLSPTQYYMVTLTPNNGSTVTVNSITFNMARSGTGPRHWAVRGSADSYSANLAASVMSNTNISVVPTDIFFWSVDSYTIATGKQLRGSTITPGSSYSNQTTPMSFRFYAWDAEAGGGSFRIDTVVFNGTNTIVSGINKLTYDLNAKFKLFPNPSNDGVVTIETATATKLEVINLLGAIVASQVIPEEKIKLDLSSLPSGTYFVKINIGDRIVTEKLILSK
ncbi:MAG: T9SS type A sorting domain-containing protein [Bacteroidia bacterium]